MYLYDRILGNLNNFMFGELFSVLRYWKIVKSVYYLFENYEFVID